MKNNNLFSRNSKERFEVLVIEDEKDDMDCVKRSLPGNCRIISEEPWFCKLCEKGIGGELLVPTEDGKEPDCIQFNNYIGEIIAKHHLTLRAIVCDLKLGDNRMGGVEFIKWIRDANTNRLEPYAEYLEYIPIIVYTKSTHSGKEEREAALANGANGFLVKDQGIVSEMRKIDENLKNVIKKNVEYFQCLYKFFLNHKPYKVGLSFTGSNGSELHREFIEEIAHQLYGYYKKDNVFYDIGKAEDGTTVSLCMQDFAKIYREDCEYVIVFVSKDYNTKDNPWTQNEWEGIKEYYRESPSNVIFVPIEAGVTSSTFRDNLSIPNEPIWINATKFRKSFYEVLSGQSLIQKSMLNEVVHYNSTMEDYMWKCFEVYKDECKKITHNVIQAIVGHILKTDSGEK